MIKKLLLIGGGGHCKSVLDIIFQVGGYDEIGIIDKPEKLGACILGIPVIGCDDDLTGFFLSGYRHAFISIGSIGNTSVREKADKILEDIGFEIPVIIDSSAVIGREVKILPGVLVGKGVIINTGASIGRHAILNSGSVIEHDCQIGDFVHVAPGVTVCGNVDIKSHAHIGAGSVIRQGLVIGRHAVIGIGSVVTKDIPAESTAYGNPCRIQQTNV